MLDYHCRVGDKRPEVVGLETGIPLEVFKESFLIGIIIRIFGTLVDSIGRW